VRRASVRQLGWTVYWLAVCVLLWGGLTKGHNWGDDFATYILHARSVLQGNPSQFVETNRFTIEASTYVIGPIAAPWGVPVLLSVPYAVFGLDMVALKIVNVVCYVLFLLTLWRGLRRHHSAFWLFVLVSLFAVNPSFQSIFMNRVLSDIPFLFFSTLALVLMGRVVIERAWVIGPVADHAVLGLAMAAAFFVRANGGLLVAALAVTQSIRALQHRRARLETGPVSPVPLAVQALPYVSFAVAVVIWRMIFPAEEYVPPSTPMSLRRVWQNLYYYTDLPADFFAGAPLPRVVYGATLPLAAIGIAHRVASTYHMIVYGILTWLLYVLWPETNGLRYVFPLLPIYMSFVISGLEVSGADVPAWRRRMWAALRIGPVLVILLYFAASSGAAAARNLTGRTEEEPGPYMATSRQLFSFIANNTDPNSVIVFFKPRALRLFTDRPSVMITRADRLAIGDYVCLYLWQDHRNQVPRDAVDRLRESGELVVVYRNADFECHGIRKERAQPR
jgi:hypothetical protein